MPTYLRSETRQGSIADEAVRSANPVMHAAEPMGFLRSHLSALDAWCSVRLADPCLVNAFASSCACPEVWMPDAPHGEQDGNARGPHNSPR